jgi:hypothetical protein
MKQVKPKEQSLTKASFAPTNQQDCNISALFSNTRAIRRGSKQSSNGHYTSQLTLHFEQAQIRPPL